MESLQASLVYLNEYSYLGVFILILVFSVLPLSKTLVIVAAGVLASQGLGTLWLYTLVSIAGLVCADLAYYLLGYVGGVRVVRWRVFSTPSRAARIVRAGELFRAYDWLAVFSARFLPFVRSFIFLVAGLNRMRPLRFTMADLLSACLYAPAAAGLGYLLGQNLPRLVETVSRAEWLVAALAVVGLVLYVLLRRRA